MHDVSRISLELPLRWALIPPFPDNFKRVIKYQAFKTSVHCDFVSLGNIVLSFETYFG